jgi:hypothetical protein
MYDREEKNTGTTKKAKTGYVESRALPHKEYPEKKATCSSLA